MAESKNQKDQKQEEDIQFSREELLSDDLRVADFAREKRNKPLPEQLRDDPSTAYGFPMPEDRYPSVMPADTASDHEYKKATYEEVDDKLRDEELRSGPGTVARAELAKTLQERSRKGESLNDVVAPPTEAAQLAADGEGAQNTPIPVARREGTTSGSPEVARAPAAKPAGNNK